MSINPIQEPSGIQKAAEQWNAIQRDLEEVAHLQSNPSNVADKDEITKLLKDAESRTNNILNDKEVPKELKDAFGKLLTDMKVPNQNIGVLLQDGLRVQEALKPTIEPVGPFPSNNPPLGPAGTEPILGPGGLPPILGPGGEPPLLGPGGTPPQKP